MSLVPLKTHISPDVALFAALGSGGGGGGGQNLTVSTIVMEGSTDPLEITLPANANDGFSVRQGGAVNPIAILTMDEAGAGQAEFGVRTLSTIAGNTSNDGQPTDSATLIYQFDKNVSGTPSTIGSLAFVPGTAPATGTATLKGEDGTGITVGNSNVIAVPAGTSLIPAKATVVGSGNIYVPAAGTTVPVAAFSTVAGHAYELYIPNLRIQNEPAGAPTAGAWSALTVDTTPASELATFDMASVSTIANDLLLSPVYNFTASGAAHNLQASASLAGALSTAITITPASIYLRDLGAPASFKTIG
jgi:hypothetical protein